MSELRDPDESDIDALESDDLSIKVPALLGFTSGLHQIIVDEVDGDLSTENNRDLDSAAVYLEAVFWKLEQVLDRINPEKPEEGTT